MLAGSGEGGGRYVKYLVVVTFATGIFSRCANKTGELWRSSYESFNLWFIATHCMSVKQRV